MTKFFLELAVLAIALLTANAIAPSLLGAIIAVVIAVGVNSFLFEQDIF